MTSYFGSKSTSTIWLPLYAGAASRRRRPNRRDDRGWQCGRRNVRSWGDVAKVGPPLRPVRRGQEVRRPQEDIREAALGGGARGGRGGRVTGGRVGGAPLAALGRNSMAFKMVVIFGFGNIKTFQTFNT